MESEGIAVEIVRQVGAAAVVVLGAWATSYFSRRKSHRPPSDFALGTARIVARSATAQPKQASLWFVSLAPPVMALGSAWMGWKSINFPMAWPVFLPLFLISGSTLLSIKYHSTIWMHLPAATATCAAFFYSTAVIAILQSERHDVAGLPSGFEYTMTVLWSLMGMVVSAGVVAGALKRALQT